jgi:hypothetical protein
MEDSMVTGEDESKEVGRRKKADVVVWGNLVHIGNVLEMETHITLLKSLERFKSLIRGSVTNRFYLDQSFSQQDVITLLRNRTQEVNDIILLLGGLSKYNHGVFASAINLFGKIEEKSASVLMLLMLWVLPQIGE